MSDVQQGNRVVRRRPVSPSARRRVYIRDDYRCVYCLLALSDASATLDHRVPVAKGGDNSEDNLATACRSCNSRKNASLSYVGTTRSSAQQHTSGGPEVLLDAACGVAHVDLKWHEKLVALILLTRARIQYEDEGWAVWPSVDTIAGDCGISRRQTLRALTTLKAKRLIEVSPYDDQHSSVRYVVRCDLMAKMKRPKGWRRPKKEPRARR